MNGPGGLGNQEGFTLVEILTAWVLLVLVIGPALYRAGSGAESMHRRLQDRPAALELLEQALDRQVDSARPESSIDTVLADGRRFRISCSPQTHGALPSLQYTVARRLPARWDTLATATVRNWTCEDG